LAGTPPEALAHPTNAHVRGAVMSTVALLDPSTHAVIAEPLRGSLVGGSGYIVLILVGVAFILALALEAVMMAARVLLEPVFALLRTLFKLLIVLAVVIGILLLLGVGFAHG
jgi:hypothetical protein